MDKRFIKLSLFLLPFALYTTIMFRMIDNVYQSDVLEKKFGKKLRGNMEKNDTYSRLERLTTEYVRIESERKALLQILNRLVVEEEHADGMKYLSRLKNKIVNNYTRAGNEYIIVEKYRQKRYPFDCTNISKIRLKQKIGHGVTKQAFLGEIGDTSVVVKMVTRHQKEVRSCLDDLKLKGDASKLSKSRCFVFSTMKMMKEILLLEQLRHDGFLSLLGYCVRNEESDSSDLSEHGVVAVYEVGQRITPDSLQYISIHSKINHAYHLLDFLKYLEHSPLGSLRIRDFKEDHFLLVESVLKMIDLDDVDNLEPSCDIYTDSDYESHSTPKRQCGFHLQCQMGLCVGHNAKQNLKIMNKLFLKRLLQPISFPKNITGDLNDLNNQLDKVKISAGEAQNRLNEIMHKLWPEH